MIFSQAGLTSPSTTPLSPPDELLLDELLLEELPDEPVPPLDELLVELPLLELLLELLSGAPLSVLSPPLLVTGSGVSGTDIRVSPAPLPPHDTVNVARRVASADVTRISESLFIAFTNH